MSQLREAVTVLQFATKIVGKEGPVYLDVNILKRSEYEFSRRDSHRDIVTIGNEGEEITLNDVCQVFEEITDNVREFWDDLKYGRERVFNITLNDEGVYEIDWCP